MTRIPDERVEFMRRFQPDPALKIDCGLILLASASGWQQRLLAVGVIAIPAGTSVSGVF